MTDSDGRILSLLIDFNCLVFNLVSDYAPNVVSNRKKVFSRLHDVFLSQGDLIIGGDLYCVENVLDRLNSSIVPLSDQKLLNFLRADFSLVDVWRKNNPRGVVFTWANSDRSQASRTDQFLIVKHLASNATCGVLPCVLSDHEFITTDHSRRGSGIWRFNNSLLSDAEFRKILCDCRLQA